MFKITVPAGHKISGCAANEKHSRFGATCKVMAYRSGDQGYLTATNGRILSITPVEMDAIEKPVYLPAKAVDSNGSATNIEVNGEVRRQCGKKTEVFPNAEQEGRFPAIKSIFPNDLSDYRNVTLDANLLKALADAISDGGCVTLLIPPAGKEGEIVSPLVAIGSRNEGAENGGIGLIMPVGGKSVASQRRAALAEHVANIPESFNIG